MLVSTIWLGLVGFLDDYIKVFRKNKEGLAGKFKVIGQIGLGAIIGVTMYWNDHVVTSREVTGRQSRIYNKTEKQIGGPFTRKDEDGKSHNYVQVRSAVTTVPFIKSHELSYAKIASVFGEKAQKVATPIIYILFVIFIIVAVSNGANITDGIDGLATGVSAIAGICLGVFAYVSGNYHLRNYLNIMHIPNLGELSVFIGAFVGACVGFLWYNAYPAQVFMGDTGSYHSEESSHAGHHCPQGTVDTDHLRDLPGGAFQRNRTGGYFKRTKRNTVKDVAFFLMSPLHHHYQLLGYHESKIVVRFWIIGIILGIFSIVTLKLQ